MTLLPLPLILCLLNTLESWPYFHNSPEKSHPPTLRDITRFGLRLARLLLIRKQTSSHDFHDLVFYVTDCLIYLIQPSGQGLHFSLHLSNDIVNFCMIIS